MGTGGGVKVVSTFAGGGGSSLGYKQAGAEVVLAIEWDDHSVQTYKANHPGTPVWQRDIRGVSGDEIMEFLNIAPGELDILDGSPPCQGFSSANVYTREIDDPRNDLPFVFLDLVEQLRPKCVLLENVAGMLAGKMRPVASAVYRRFEELGYRLDVRLMEAQWFGVSQLRKRAFFMASRLGQPVAPRPISKPIPAGKALLGVEPVTLFDNCLSPRWKFLLKHMRPYERGQDMLQRLVREGKLEKNAKLTYMADKGYWFSWRMLHPAKPSVTVTKIPMLLHWERRPVAVEEALVLTGFPVDYKLDGSYQARWNRIGNAVAPPMTREIARQTFAPLLTKS